MTSALIANGTSLPVLESGPLAPVLPDGPMPAPSAPRRARASRTAAPVSNSESMIQGICGRTYIESSVPPAQADSALLFGWESKLRKRLAMVGSTEYALIWREKTSPAGRSISRLARSTRHTNGIDSTGSLWPTPKASSAGETSRSGDRSDEPLMGGLMRQATWRSPTAGDNRGGAYSDPAKALARMDSGHTINLEDQMVVAAWSTPRASDGEKGGPNQSFSAGGQPLPAQMYGVDKATWATPTLHGNFNVKGMSPTSGDGIATQMRGAVATWITPSARDGKDTPGMATVRPDGGSRIDMLPRQMMHLPAPSSEGTDPTSPIGSGSPVTTAKRGAPNPVFPCLLMGWPDEVIFGALRGIQSLRSSRPKSSKRSSMPRQKKLPPPPY
jgi:hypothetical protein